MSQFVVLRVTVLVEINSFYPVRYVSLGANYDQMVYTSHKRYCTYSYHQMVYIYIK